MSRIQSILAISKEYNQRPSEIIELTNAYESFCFDEACIYIMNELSKEDCKKPKWSDIKEIKTNNNDVIEWLKNNENKNL